MSRKKAKLIIVSAPSGAGKTTLVKHLLESINDLCFSISATSRPKRNEETDGKDYYFLTRNAFKRLIAKKAFLEWEEVYEGVFYGTLKSEVERITKEGKFVLFDVDVLGGLNIKKQYTESALSIFIQPPNLAELEKRLLLRSSDSDDSIRERVTKAAIEIEYARFFDLVINNDSLNVAKKEIVDEVQKFIANE